MFNSGNLFKNTQTHIHTLFFRTNGDRIDDTHKSEEKVGPFDSGTMDARAIYYGPELVATQTLHASSIVTAVSSESRLIL